MPVNLHGVDTDYLAGEPLGNLQSQLCFSYRSWTTQNKLKRIKF
jgi:hypothetical protein